MSSSLWLHLNAHVVLDPLYINTDPSQPLPEPDSPTLGFGLGLELSHWLGLAFGGDDVSAYVAALFWLCMDRGGDANGCWAALPRGFFGGLRKGFRLDTGAMPVS